MLEWQADISPFVMSGLHRTVWWRAVWDTCMDDYAHADYLVSVGGSIDHGSYG